MVAEARVGILFIVVVLVTVVCASYLSGRLGWMSGQHVLVHYHDVEGLSEGSAVLFSGMEIGRVLEIRMATAQELTRFKEMPIVVHLALKSDVVLKSTDEFVIAQAGLLGENHIAVRRKTQKQREAEARLHNKEPKQPTPLQGGAHVVGRKTAGITEMGDDARQLLAQMKSAIADFQSLYAGPEMRERLPTILANVEAATAHALQFSEVLSRLSIENQAQVGQIARQIAGAAKQLNAGAARIRQMVAASAPDIEASTSRVAQMIDGAAGNVEATSDYLRQTGRLVAAGAEDIEASTKSARATLTRVSKRLDDMTAASAEDIRKTTGYVEQTTRLATERFQQLIAKSSGNIENAAAAVEQTTAKMAQLVQTSQKDINQSTRRIADMVSKSAGDVESASADLAGLSKKLHEDLGQVSGRTRKMVEQSAADIEQTTSRVAKLAERSAQDVERTTRRIHDTLAMSPLPNDLATASGHIRRAAQNVEKLTAHFNDTLGSEQFAASITKTVDNLAQASDHLVAMGAEGEQLVKQGRTQITDEKMWQDVRETVAKLRQSADDLSAIVGHGREVFTSPQLTEDVTGSIANIRLLTQKGSDLAASADDTLKRVNETVAGVQNVSRKFQPEYTRGYLNLEAVEDYGLRADLAADFFFDRASNQYWRLGIRDLGDKETLMLQRGVELSKDDALRLGIIGNKLGMGYDRRLSGDLSVELDLWDPDDARLDTRLLWGLGDDWQVVFGANRVLGGSDPFIGVRRAGTLGGQAGPRPAGNGPATERPQPSTAGSAP